MSARVLNQRFCGGDGDERQGDGGCVRVCLNVLLIILYGGDVVLSCEVCHTTEVQAKRTNGQENKYIIPGKSNSFRIANFYRHFSEILRCKFRALLDKKLSGGVLASRHKCWCVPQPAATLTKHVFLLSFITLSLFYHQGLIG